MSTVAPPVRGAQPAPPARHGTCKLRLFINSDEYALKRRRAGNPGSRIWSLRKVSGNRAGAVYSVARAAGAIACTCPDYSNRGLPCKHIRALVASGLLSGRRAPRPKGGAL